MTRVLLTGIAGFAGSHCAWHVLRTTDWEVVGIVRAGTDRQRIPDDPRVRLVSHDLRQPITPRLIRDIGPVDYAINMAAQSDVEHSLLNPVPTAQNNVGVTLNLLEWARAATPKVFLQASTVEVYGPARKGHRHMEWEPPIPSNPYAASKAAQEAFVIAYWRAYGVPVVLTNTMNIFGEKQQPARLVPTVIRKVLTGETVPIYGQDGVPGSRYYIHARNQADALLYLLTHVTPQRYPRDDRPSRFHVVGEQEIDNVTMAQKIARVVGKPLHYELQDVYGARPGHDLRYALDGTKLAMVGWKTPMAFEESLERTVRWTLKNPEWLANGGKDGGQPRELEPAVNWSPHSGLNRGPSPYQS